jgi:hypothetical protein
MLLATVQIPTLRDCPADHAVRRRSDRGRCVESRRGIFGPRDEGTDRSGPADERALQKVAPEPDEGLTLLRGLDALAGHGEPDLLAQPQDHVPHTADERRSQNRSSQLSPIASSWAHRTTPPAQSSVDAYSARSVR